MDANNYETMEPAKNTINSDRNFLYCSWHPFAKQKVRLNKYIISGSTTCHRLWQKRKFFAAVHLASHNISHIHTKTGRSGDFQVSKSLKKRLLFFHWINLIFLSLLTGRIFRFKLIRLNGHHFKITIRSLFTRRWPEHMRLDNLDKQPSYVITPESLARRSKWRSREVRTRLEGLSWEAKKKNLKRENIFLCEKSTFGDLKSILGDIFLKSGGSL